MPEAAFCILIFYMEAPFRLIQWKFFSVHAADFDVAVLTESLNYHINFFRQSLQFCLYRAVIFIPYPAGHTKMPRQMRHAIAESHTLDISVKLIKTRIFLFSDIRPPLFIIPMVSISSIQTNVPVAFLSF